MEKKKKTSSGIIDLRKLSARKLKELTVLKLTPDQKAYFIELEARERATKLRSFTLRD